MCMTLKRRKFVDSLNFLPVALSKLPKVFGSTELKHFFPYWTRQSTKTYPSTRILCPDQMSEEGRSSFSTWYETQKDTLFSVQSELLKYCISDVDILERACGECNPFVKSTMMPFTRSVDSLRMQ